PISASAGSIKISAVGATTFQAGTLTIYAAVTSSSGAFSGVFKGTPVADKGVFDPGPLKSVFNTALIWSKVTPASVPAETLGNNASTILTTDGTTVYFADQNDIQVPTNGGAGGTDVTKDSSGNAPAAGFHALAIDGSNVLVGTDGGLWSLATSGHAWTD